MLQWQEIYNSRNYLRSLNEKTEAEKYLIYNSRNYLRSLNDIDIEFILISTTVEII